MSHSYSESRSAAAAQTKTKQTVITANSNAMAVELEQAARGAYATVVDGGKYHGLYFFGSTSDVALRCLLAKINQSEEVL